jgi:2,6-dihydroxypseudooxynicotine hydrolase
MLDKLRDRLLGIPGEFLEPLVDLRLRFLGPGAFGEMLARVLVVFGADHDDVIDVLERSRNLTEVAGNFSDLGWDWEKRGRRELEAQHRESARDAFKRAAIYYAVEAWGATSQGAIHDAYVDIGRCYDRFRELSRHPIEKVEIPYGDKTLPGFLRRPVGSRSRVGKDPAPLFVIIQGMDSLKEWLELFERRALERGFATLNFDLPGNGESLARGIALHHPDDILEVGRGLRSFVDGLDGVDRGRIVLFGFSLGGQWALGLTPHEMEPVAVATLGAPYDYSFLERMTPQELRRAAFATGHESVGEIRRKVEGVSLRGALRRIEVPVLVIHGELDREVRVWHAESIHNALTCPKELLVIEGEDHLTTRSLRRRVLPYAVDWLMDRVVESRPDVRVEFRGGSGSP